MDFFRIQTYYILLIPTEHLSYLNFCHNWVLNYIIKLDKHLDYDILYNSIEVRLSGWLLPLCITVFPGGDVQVRMLSWGVFDF